MKRKRARAELVALGHTPFEPTDEQRKQVRIHTFNGLSEERIAALLGITLEELVYHFASELEYSEDEIIGFCAERMVYLAGQNVDLGVSLRASQHVLQARSKRWRIPKDENAALEGGQKRIGKMTLNEVEQELAKMDERRRAAASAPDTEGQDPSG